MLRTPKKFYPAGICFLKVNNENTRLMSEVCSNLITKAPDNDVALMPLLITLNIFYMLSWYSNSWLWARKCLLGEDKKGKHLHTLVNKLVPFYAIYSWKFCKLSERSNFHAIANLSENYRMAASNNYAMLITQVHSKSF